MQITSLGVAIAMTAMLAAIKLFGPDALTWAVVASPLLILAASVVFVKAFIAIFVLRFFR